MFRSVVSIVFVGLTRAAGKPVFYSSACFLLGVDREELDNHTNINNNNKRLAVELSYKVRRKSGFQLAKSLKIRLSSGPFQGR
jgi:hypothetical protein